MKSKLSNVDKINRIERLLYELESAIKSHSKFNFTSKAIEHKITWAGASWKLKSILIDDGFLEQGPQRGSYLFSEKAESVSIPDLAAIMAEKMTEPVEMVFEETHANSLIPVVPEDAEEDEAPLELDDIEWAVIKLGLRRIADGEDEVYTALAERVLQKI